MPAASRCALAVVAAVVAMALAAAPAGAQYAGFGASTPGGAGQPVVRVTTLADAGPGSLREALAQGYRTVVFDVAGDIALADFLYVRGPYVTLDGFSAPPPGITLRNYGLIIRGTHGAHDVIVRGLRVRNATVDGIQVAYGAHNVVIDHCSVQGSEDGNIDITEDAHDVTVSWSVLSRPAGGEKNMLVKYRAQRVSLHHNVFVAAAQRNPQVAVDDVVLPAIDTTVDMRNNIVWGWGTGVGTVVRNGARANVVGNFYSAQATLAIDQAQALIVCTFDCGEIASYPAWAYVAGNYSADGVLGINGVGTLAAPLPAPDVGATDACTAAHAVLAGAGVRPLDDVDTLYLAGIRLPACVPDLAVLSLSAPLYVTPGIPFVASDVVHNVGPADGPAATLSFHLSTDAYLGATDRLLGTRAVPALAAATASPGSTTLTIPASTAPGVFRLMASVVPPAGTTEGGLANNVRVQTVRVVRPDLRVTSIVAPLEAAPGAVITVTDTTANLGYGIASPSSTRFYLSRDAVRGAGDADLGARGVPGLASRQVSVTSTQVVIPPGTVPGRYYIVAVADADGGVTETYELNNSRARAITIR